jgi:hypothetical protein
MEAHLFQQANHSTLPLPEHTSLKTNKKNFGPELIPFKIRKGDLSGK